MAERLYVYVWGNNERRVKLKGRLCRILGRGCLNTIVVEFVDTGERVTTSGNAIRRVKKHDDG